MSEQIRLLWDFFGPHAERTAQHHCVHLVEFTRREGLGERLTGVESVAEGHVAAWMIVEAHEVERFRRALRPQRGLPA